MTKKQRILTVLLALILLLSVITVTYAFFTASTSNDNQEVLSVSAGTLKLTFADVNSTGYQGEMNFGDSKTASFSITNDGNVDTYAKIDWNGITNTYLEGSLVYTLAYSTTQDGTYTNIVENKNVPQSTSAQVLTLKDNLLIPANTTYYYKLTITLVYSQTVDQTQDLTATFNTGFKIEEGTESSFKIISGDLNTVGSEVAIGTENFYVISSDSTNVNLLAKYNLGINAVQCTDSHCGTLSDATGMQDERAFGYAIRNSSVISYGAISFSSTNYWWDSSSSAFATGYTTCLDSSNSKCNNSYPYVYDSNSYLYSYVENYVEELNNKYSADAIGRLMSYEEAVELGCSHDNYSCGSAPSWILQTSFWLGSALNYDMIWGVDAPASTRSDNAYSFEYIYYNWSYLYGIRPVITMSKSLFS